MSEKYGSLLYNITEVEKTLAKVRSSAEKMNEERGKIMEIPDKIQQKGWPYEKDDKLNFGSRLSSHFSSSAYRTFDSKNERHIQEALKNADTKYPICLAEAEKLHALNIPIIENNQKCRKNIADFLESYGIRRTKYVSQTVRRQTKTVEVACEWATEINSQIPIDDGYSSYVSSIKSDIEQIKKDAQTYLAEIAKIKAIEDKKLSESKELAEAILFYKEKNWSTENLSSQEILDYVENYRRDKWIKENYPDGTEMNHSCCDNCSSWTVGEHRCSCGNRRMSLIVEGSKDSYYAYAEAH